MGLKIITRSQAKSIGLKRYFTGKPCKFGGIAERVVSSGMCKCDFCRKARAGIKAKSYRKTIETTKLYLQRNAKRLSDNAALYRAKNRDRMLKFLREYYLSNKEKYVVHRAKRKAVEKSAAPAWDEELDTFVVAEAADLCARRKAVTAIDWHVDHMIPLQAKHACGLHVWNNLQVIPAKVNIMKGNKMIITGRGDWIHYV